MNRRDALRLSVAAMATAAAQDPPNPKPSGAETDAQTLERLGNRGVRVHDPVVIRADGEYHAFYTGRGVPSFRSKDLVTWTPGPRVFDAAPAWVAGAVPGRRDPLHFWAPEVVRMHGRYALYYSVSAFGKNTSVIALATNATLDPASPEYRWEDRGIVTRSAPPDDFNAIDPAVMEDASGRWWMAFGSFWGGIMLVEIDPTTGLRKEPDAPPRRLAFTKEIEAAHLARRGEWSYLIVNWGFCCRGVRSTYNLRIGRSREVTGPYLDKDGRDLLRGGGTLLLGPDGPFIGPGHAGIFEHEGRPQISMHFYDGTTRGLSRLAIRPLRWDDDGWPVVGP